ncbi:MAG: gamma-glutamyltransferase family protein [Burkholderiaceae bacterium]|nr:gamma-glutamyltransferase family protein [Burkholderiaceae bacterium]
MRLAAAITAFALLLAGCAARFSDGISRDQPEAAHTRLHAISQASQTARGQIVSTANPLASAAGLEMLRAGGSAIDAAIAAQLVLTLVEPQSSGIGGGALLLHHNGDRLQAFDGRETAPGHAHEDLFLKDGRPMAFAEAVVGGRSVGTPGVLRMLALAHQQHGRLAWERLFTPAIALAEEGFPISPRLHALLEQDPHLRKDPQARTHFYQPDGSAKAAGTRLRNPDLAAIYRTLAKTGAESFYIGDLAEQIVDTVRRHPTAPGLLRTEDLKNYRPRIRDALCFPFPAAIKPAAGVEICGFPPPSSGAITIGQILQILNRLDSAQEQAPSPRWMHHYIEASRLAFADRAQFIADPDFVAPPAGSWASLLDPTYLQQRAALIGSIRMPTANPGNPQGMASKSAAMNEQFEEGTSHLSIADRYGNTLSMTSTIESAFGARLMVSPTGNGGFLLNNQLTDFSFVPRLADGMLIANRIEPGKRPRSSMSPTLIYERRSDGSRGPVIAALGSPGGASILHYTTKTILGLLQWQLDPQTAINQPNFVINGPQAVLQIESYQAGMQHLAKGLQQFGQPVQEIELVSGIQAIVRRDGLWQGGSDPRREGISVGD